MDEGSQVGVASLVAVVRVAQTIDSPVSTQRGQESRDAVPHAVCYQERVCLGNSSVVAKNSS